MLRQSQVIATHSRPLPGLLRILLVGQELRVEALRALLSLQEDMKILGPILEIDHAAEVIVRMNGADQPIDVVVIDWDGDMYSEMYHHILQVLASRSIRCLIISSQTYPGEIKHIEEAGAAGYCVTSASPVQLAAAIRRVAGGKKVFHFPTGEGAGQPILKVRRHLVFYRERLEERAREIGWDLNQTDINIISHFDSDTNTQIAGEVNRRPTTIRTKLSERVFLFLQLLSGRSRIPNKKAGFQVLLEFGIFEYK